MRARAAVGLMVSTVMFATGGCAPSTPANPAAAGKSAPPAGASDEQPADSPAPKSAQSVGGPSSDPQPIGAQPSEAPPQGVADSAPTLDSLQADLAADEEARQVAAADGIAAQGRAAAAAVPELVKALGTPRPEVLWRVQRALAAIGPAAAPAVPALQERLADTDPRVRAYAAYALGKIGDAAKPAVPDLAKAVADPQPDVRRAALNALRDINAGPEVVIPLLDQVFNDAEPAVVMAAIHTMAESGEEGMPALKRALAHPKGRYWACLVLSELGPAGKDAVPELTEIVQVNDEPELVLQALIALGSMGPDAKAALPAVLEASKQGGGVGYAAVFAMGQIGDPAAQDVLNSLVDSDDPFLRMVSAWAVANISPTDAHMERAARLISAGLTSDSEVMRRGAAQALVELRGPREKFAPILVEALQNANPTVLAQAGDAIAALGPRIVPQLTQALNNPDLRDLALRVLARLGPDAKEAVPALTQALAQADTDQFRSEVQFALASIGPDAAPAVPELTRSLANPNEQVERSAIFALGRIGPAAKSAVPALAENIDAEDPLIRMGSIWAIHRIQPGERTLLAATVPVLSAALAAESPLVRREAATALGELGDPARPALPVLAKLASDDDDLQVRAAAAEAVKKIEGRP